MTIRPRLGELLVEAGAIDPEQLSSALAEHKRRGRPLGATLVEMKLLDEETLVRTLARQLHVPVVWLRGKAVRPEVLELVPPELADTHRCLPVLIDRRGGKKLILAMENPTDVAAIDRVARLTGLEIKPALAAPAELEEALLRHYPGQAVSTGDLDLKHAIFADEVPSEGQPELLNLSHPEVLSSAPFELESAPGAEPPVQGAVASDAILRALTQLLVEKGIISRDELVERLGALETEKPDDA